MKKKLSEKFAAFKSIFMFISILLPAIAGCDCDNTVYYNSTPNEPYFKERIFVSTDAGETWQKQYSNGYGFKMIGYTYVNSGYKLVVANGTHTLVYSTNLGTTWKDTSLISNTSGFKDMAFSSYDGVFSIVTNTNVIYHSTDNAATWSFQNAPAGEKLKFIDFRPSTTLYQAAVGDFNDRIYLSTNGGNFWVYTGTGITGTERFTGIKFIRDNIIAAFGYDSLMLRSTDYGNSWAFQDLPGTASLLTMDANPELQFLIGGSNTAGKFFYSPDLGNTWELKNFTSSTYNSRYFSISYSGIIIGVGNQGEMIKSTDMGNTWRKISEITDNDFMDVLFVNNTLVVAVCN